MSDDFRAAMSFVPKGYALTLSAEEGGWVAVIQRATIIGLRVGPKFAAKDVTMAGAVRAAVDMKRRH